MFFKIKYIKPIDKVGNEEYNHRQTGKYYIPTKIVGIRKKTGKMNRSGIDKEV